ncbi:MAG: hypothetical protein LBC61_06030 [Candidatus Peribacteria bacterium]|nr:hypothetical protein [Candidatus Peribacteria bacterium]
MPTIILAINGNGSVDVNNSDSKKTFVFNEQDNLPYTFVSPYSPLANGATYNSITNDGLKDFVEDYLKPNNFYWQNSDYRSCGEIEEAGKRLA